MRNQEISACVGNVSYKDVRQCAGFDAAAGSRCFGKIKPGLPKGRDPQAAPPAAGLQAQTMHSTLNPAEEHCTGMSCWLISVYLRCAHSEGIAGEWGSDNATCLCLMAVGLVMQSRAWLALVSLLQAHSVTEIFELHSL